MILSIGKQAGEINKRLNLDNSVELNYNSPNGFCSNISTIEDHEARFDLSETLNVLPENVVCIISATEPISASSLMVLEQIKNKKIEVILLTYRKINDRQKKVLQSMLVGVIKEYTRSGNFLKMTCIEVDEVDKLFPQIPLYKKKNVVYDSISSTIRWIKFFENNEPFYGSESTKRISDRIYKISIISNDNSIPERSLWDEKWAMKNEMTYIGLSTHYMDENKDSVNGLIERLPNPLVFEVESETPIIYKVTKTSQTEQFAKVKGK